MDNFENKIRKYFGIPVEQHAQAAGQTVDDAYARMLALLDHRRGTPQVVPQVNPAPVVPVNTATSGAPIDYNRLSDEEDKRNIENAKKETDQINNAEAPIDESIYKKYAQGGTTGGTDGLTDEEFADGGTVNGFPQLQGMMKPTYGKATAEADASRNSMEFMKKNKNMNIKGKRGISF